MNFSWRGALYWSEYGILFHLFYYFFQTKTTDRPIAWRCHSRWSRHAYIEFGIRRRSGFNYGFSNRVSFWFRKIIYTSASIVFRYLLHTKILINTLILRLCNIIVSQNTLNNVFWQDNARFLSKANSNTIHINFLLKRYLETLLLRIFFHSRFPSRPSGTTPLEKFS